MKHLSARTTGEAWLKAMIEVSEHGQPIHDGEQLLQESLNIFLTIEEPLAHDPLLDRYADPTMLDWMRANFLQRRALPEWGYSYGQRFFDYDGLNQVEQVIEKLKKNPDSKSATITLMHPTGDKKHMPCIVALDFKLRDGRLMTTGYFRSQDVGKKIYADIICIAEIARTIAQGIGAHEGALHLLIVSLHAYQADWERMRHCIAHETYEVLSTDYV